MHAKVPTDRGKHSWAIKPANLPVSSQALESAPTRSAERKDHFMYRDGFEFAGVHLIVDFWGAVDIGNLSKMEKALRSAIEAARATLIHIHLHHFGEGAGVSGVAVLAESHISVHTWPERDFAAFDIFMCGDSQPKEALRVLKGAFTPVHTQVVEELRGRINNHCPSLGL